jgi:hypothetical protein
MQAQNQINNNDEINNSSSVHARITKINNYNSRLAELEENVKLLTRKQLTKLLLNTLMELKVHK